MHCCFRRLMAIATDRSRSVLSDHSSLRPWGKTLEASSYHEQHRPRSDRPLVSPTRRPSLGVVIIVIVESFLSVVLESQSLQENDSSRYSRTAQETIAASLATNPIHTTSGNTVSRTGTGLIDSDQPTRR